jgi:murein DD-endopeptidase MepM/ murein hydrolase activator NlpD
MLRLSILACFLLLLTGCGADDAQPVSYSEVAYRSPVDYDITLAGNFGEPRPFHFHGGLDVKTDNQEGKPIYAIADGYVSRLTVNMYGFGNAIYVSHPDGKTSVYCHLRHFADRYEAQLQRTGARDTLTMAFPPVQFPVKAGDLIAISGNTGHSTGPHLHLELHDTQTWVLRDPMSKLAALVSDTVAPQAHSFMACPVEGEGVFNGSSAKQTFGFGAPVAKVQRSEWTVRHEFTAWGRVGFALWADDYSEATYNHYGVRYTQLLVDGSEVFHSLVDSIPISCQLEVNDWGDFDHWRRYHVWYLKSFREPGMRLPLLHTNFEQGVVCFSEERPYHLTYVLRDYQGNESRYHFIVHGQRSRGLTPRPRRQLLNPYLLYRQVTWPLHSVRIGPNQ